MGSVAATRLFSLLPQDVAVMAASAFGEIWFPQNTLNQRLPSVKQPAPLLGNLALGKKQTERLVPEDGFQLFQVKGWDDSEHVLCSQEQPSVAWQRGLKPT